MPHPASADPWAGLRPAESVGVTLEPPAPAADRGWRARSSGLAFICTLVLIGSFTRIELFTPGMLDDDSLREVRSLTPTLIAAVALGHAAVAAFAASFRRVPAALAALLLGAAALPVLAEAARAPLHALLQATAPHYCSFSPHSCPPGAWSPLVGALVGLLLAPVVVAAVRLRDQRSHDTTARMLYVTGAWTALVAAALRAAHLAVDEAFALACAVGVTCAVVGAADTGLRWRRLTSLLRANRLSVSAPRHDDPAGLRPYASLPPSVDFDAVLRLDEVRAGSPYRALRDGRAFARSPRDASALVRGLARRGVRQVVLLGAVVAALLAATTIGAGPVEPREQGVLIITSD